MHAARNKKAPVATTGVFLENNMPEQVELEITTLCSTHRYGNLAPGDILRTDAAYARPLVDEARAAKYITARPAAESPALPAQKPPRKKPAAKN
jgi:hypothetical protein